MKAKILFLVAIGVFGLSGVTSVYADGCYICEGGSYVKYSGGDDQTKRKSAKACGCTITGTRGDCSAANLKVLCSVKNESMDQNERLACSEIKADKQNKNETLRLMN